MKRLAIALLSAAAACAYADEPIWAANPSSGPQPMVNSPPLTLLSVPSDSPLQTTTGDKCLLVSRRGSQTVAVELNPLKIGPRVIGWKPKEISADQLTKDWEYKAEPLTPTPKYEPKKVEGQLFDNPITSQFIMSNQSLGNGYNNVSSASSSWSNSSVDAHGKATTETESTVAVTINGKTYRKYTHFKSASQDTPTPASDEYFCK